MISETKQIPTAKKVGLGHRLDTKDLWCLSLLLILIGGFYYPAIHRIGFYNVDAGVYLSGAQSLVEGRGYRFIAHYGAPEIGVYPPMQSLWNAFWWKLGGTFPANIPWINLGQAVLGLAASALLFLFWRWSGLPRAITTVLVGIWSTSPVWTWQLFAPYSDPGFMVICLLAAVLWVRPDRSSATISWGWTGLIMGIGFLWRTAALGPIVGLGIAVVVHSRGVFKWPVFAYATPVGALMLLWGLIKSSAAGYGVNIVGLLQMAGGMQGYLHLLLTNFIYSLKGIPFWEPIFPAVARVPVWFNLSSFGQHVYEGFEGLAFLILVFYSWRGFQRVKTRFDSVLLISFLFYIPQVLLLPTRAEHFPRYLMVLIPFFLVWIWRGFESIKANFFHRTLLPILVIALLVNASLSIIISRRQTPQISLKEFKESVEWTKSNIPTDSNVAANISLPFFHWYAETKRPLVVDYFDAKWLPSSYITHASQGYPRVDFVLMESKDLDPRIDQMPWLFEEVFKTSHGSFRIAKVKSAGQERFRAEKKIPPPTDTRK